MGLLVEDNEFNQIVATELLVGVAGMKVELAKTGVEALKKLQGAAFDVVLMDVQTPEMDGYQATAKIRQEARFARLPIVALTAHAMARDREACMAAGMNDYVTKPFEPSELFSVLYRWTSSSSGSSDSIGDMSGEQPSEITAGVDVQHGLRRGLGNAGLYGRIVQRFLQSRVDDPERLRSALTARNHQTIYAIAHDLTSTAGTLGATGLSEAANALQTAIQDGDVSQESLSHLVNKVAREHEQVIVDLQRFAEKNVGGVETRGVSDASETGRASNSRTK